MKNAFKKLPLLIGAVTLATFGGVSLINNIEQKPVEIKADNETSMKISWAGWNGGWYFYFPMNLVTDYPSSNTEYTTVEQKARVLEILDWSKVELRKDGVVVDNTAFKSDGIFVTRNSGDYLHSFGFKLNTGDASWQSIFDCITFKEGFSIPTADYLNNGGVASSYTIQNEQSFGFRTNQKAGGNRIYPVGLTKIDRFYIGNSTYWFAHLTAETDFVNDKTTTSGRVAYYNFLDKITFDGEIDPVQYAFFRNNEAYPNTFGSKWTSTGTAKQSVNKVIIPGGTVIPSYSFAYSNVETGLYGYYVIETATCIKNAFAGADYLGVVEVVNSFIDNNLYMSEDVPGQCLDYWPTTVAAYEAMNSGSRQLFMEGSNDGTVTFTNAKNRFVAWATANKYQIDNFSVVKLENGSNLMNISPMFVIVAVGVTSLIICSFVIWVMNKKKKRA